MMYFTLFSESVLSQYLLQFYMFIQKVFNIFDPSLNNDGTFSGSVTNFNYGTFLNWELYLVIATRVLLIWLQC